MSQGPAPLVSVLIPVYNGEAYIGRAVESVLAQTMQDFEIVVIDDGSTDRTLEVLSKYPRCRVLTQPNSGIGFTRQRLVQEAAADWVAFLDHDDYWSANKLELQWPHTRNPNVALIHTGFRWFTEDGSSTTCDWRPAPDATPMDHLVPMCRVNTCATLIRRSVLLEREIFPPDLSQAEDLLGWFRIAAAGDFAFVPDLLTHTLRRPGSASEVGPSFWEAERKVIEERILPGFDEAYSRFTAAQRARIRRELRRKLSILASLQAAHLDREGQRAAARQKHLEALRWSKRIRGTWWKFAKHLLRMA